MSELNLPDGWLATNLGSLVELKYGKSLPAQSRDGESFPVYGSNGIVGKHSKPLLTGPGLIVGRKGSYGEVQFSSTPFFPIDTTYYVDEFCSQPIRYWYYQLKFLPLTELNRSTAIPGLNREDAYEQSIALPPLAEQKVIAEKLDSLLAQVDNTKARLERIPEILKRFRQSVLAAAVSGKLTGATSEWRQEMLKSCFECIDGDRGPNYPKKDDYHSNGYCLYLSTKNVREFGFDFSDTVFISKDKDKVLRKGRLERGDIVITTRGTLGYVASYDETVPFDVVRINSGMLILRKKNSKFINDYFKILLASPYFQKLIEDQRTGSAQPQLPAKILKDFVLPIPEYKEQSEIVRRVEELLAFADRIEQAAQAALSRVTNLTQSILAKAFRGEMTADWRAANPELISGENSAEALLARIKAERAATSTKTNNKTKAKNISR